MTVSLTGDGPNIALTGSGSSFTITVTTGGGGGGAIDSVNGQTGVVVLDVDDVDGRDIYRPALVMSPASVAAFGGSMVNGVSLTIAALASSIPVGQDILIWDGTNGGAPNGSYTHAGSGNFTYSDRQYLNATSFENGCVLVESADYATTNADGEQSLWAISTSNGTTFGLVALAGQAMRLSVGPSSYTNGRPALFDTTDGKWLKEGTAIGGDLVGAVDAAAARTALGLGTAATAATGDFAAASHGHDVLSNVATSTILGRITAGSGDSEELTPAQARSVMSVPALVAPAFPVVSSVADWGIPGFIPTSTAGTAAISTNRVFFEPFIVTSPITIDRIAVEVTTASGAATVARLGIYNDSGLINPGSLVIDAGTVALDPGSVPAIQAATISQTLQPGRYLGVIVASGAATLRTLNGYTDGWPSIMSTAGSPHRNTAQLLNQSALIAGGYGSSIAGPDSWSSGSTSPFATKYIRYRYTAA